MTQTIADVTRREDYVATAAQVLFPYSFPIQASSELAVYKDAALQSEGTHYTVSGAGTDAGGNVTFLSAMGGGEKIIINGDKPIERLTNFSTAQQVLLASELNTELNAQAIGMQQLERDIRRCIYAPVTDQNPVMQLPSAADRAEKYAYFNANGDIEAAELLASGTTLSQSVIAGYLWPTEAYETAAGATIVNPIYPPGHPKRYQNNLDPGVTDMSAGIQMAYDVQFQSQVSHASSTPDTMGFAIPVQLGSDRYVISQEINITSDYSWSIAHYAIIIKAAGFVGTNAFSHAGNAWRVGFKQIIFEDFPRAIYLDSSNTNSGLVEINRCMFFGMTEFAIHLDVQSSQTFLLHNMFRSCVHELLIETGDKVTMVGGWIQRGLLADDYDGGIHVGTASDKAILTMDSVLLVPRVQTVTEPAYIKNYGTVNLREMRVGGEPGQHTLVNNFIAGTANTQDPKYGVDITGGDLYVGASQPVVRLFEIPNFVNVHNSRGMTGSAATILDWSASISGGDQTTKLAVVGTAVIRHWNTITGNVLPSSVAANLHYFTDFSNRRILASEDGSNRLVFDRRAATIVATDQYGQIEWIGRDTTTDAGGVRASMRTEATGSNGGVKTVIANAAPSSTSLVDMLAVGADGITIGETWNGPHLIMGAYHLWVDSTGDLRIKSGAPASDTDGAIVGVQS